jgi:CubicO group peptidase (beta-lactamase class C family)
MKRMLTAVIVVAAISPRAAEGQQLGRDVDAFVKRVMEITGASGLAIAVVQGDAPILLEGYGYADIERRRPITPRTQFYIASTTKAFTALTLALLAERGQLDLDAPITRYLRGVKWAPAINADSITVRQLLSHTHGITNSGPVVWRTAFTGVHTNTLLKELLQYHGPNGKGREFQYSNVGYNIAGLLLDDLTGKRWQDMLEQTVLKPLGMRNTTAYISRYDSAALALPYSFETSGPRRLHYAKTDANMQAAGGLVSNAEDLARWLEVQINRGRLDGVQVIPRRVIEETQRLHAPTSGGAGDYKALGYALGWNVGELYGDTILQHGGGFSTFRTLLAFSPQQQLGVAIVTAQGGVGGLAVDVISDFVFERVLRTDWKERGDSVLAGLPTRVAQIRDRIGADRARRAQRPQTLSHPLTAYIGEFRHAQRGEMKWSVKDDRLTIAMGALQSVTEVFDAGKNQLRAELEPGSGEVFEFIFENNRAVAVRYSGAVYERVP